jgi:hypothetical protein
MIRTMPLRGSKGNPCAAQIGRTVLVPAVLVNVLLTAGVSMAQVPPWLPIPPPRPTLPDAPQVSHPFFLMLSNQEFKVPVMWSALQGNPIGSSTSRPMA